MATYTSNLNLKKPALDDDALDFLNAAGDLNEKKMPENDLFSNSEKLL